VSPEALSMVVEGYVVISLLFFFINTNYLENFEKPFGQATSYLFIHRIICYENFNRLRAEGGVQASGTAWRSAGGD